MLENSRVTEFALQCAALSELLHTHANELDELSHSWLSASKFLGLVSLAAAHDRRSDDSALSAHGQLRGGTLAHVLRVLNGVLEDQPGIVMTYSTVGIFPAVYQYARRGFPVELRREVARCARVCCISSPESGRVFAMCGGAHALVNLLRPTRGGAGFAKKRTLGGGGMDGSFSTPSESSVETDSSSAEAEPLTPQTCVVG